MVKKIIKILAAYYLIGVVFLLLITSIWQDDGVVTIHAETIKTSMLSIQFWLQAIVWPIFIACYFPENIICHA